MTNRKNKGINQEEALKFLESNARFIEKEAKYLKSYYFHKRNRWLFYIPFYQMAYLWKITLWGLRANESIKTTAQLNINFEKHHKIRR